MIPSRKSRLPQWKVRFVVYKRGEGFEVEALNAGAAGVGDTALKAMDGFVELLKSLAVVSHERGSLLTIDEDADDRKFFKGLAAGHVPPDVAAFGELTLRLRPGRKAEIAHLEKMELAGVA
jgi:hypothetical protein